MVDGFGDDLYDSVLERKSLSEQTVPNGRQSSGIGYVIIPTDVDRDAYVESCTRKKTVSILTEQGETINDVSVGKLAMQFIEFPKLDGNNSRKLGSPVGFVNIPSRNKPLIFDVFDASDEFNVCPEQGFNITKRTSESTASVTGNGGTGNMSVASYCKKGDNTLDVSVRSKTITSTLRVVVDGITSLFSRKMVKLKSGEGFFFEVKDEEKDNTTSSQNVYARLSFDNPKFKLEIGNVNPSTLEFIEGETSIFQYDTDTATIYPVKKVNMGKGTEAMVLGDTLKTLMDDFITEVSNITTVTLIGVQPVVNKAALLALKQRTANILSKYGFLD